MKRSSIFLKSLLNIQILSALIWACTIIACAWITDKSNLSTILMTAAGLHVILLAQFEGRKVRG